ncbi:hypothetical protein D3C76_1765100 [compost metagenome]
MSVIAVRVRIIDASGQLGILDCPQQPYIAVTGFERVTSQQLLTGVSKLLECNHFHGVFLAERAGYFPAQVDQDS